MLPPRLRSGKFCSTWLVDPYTTAFVASRRYPLFCHLALPAAKPGALKVSCLPLNSANAADKEPHGRYRTGLSRHPPQPPGRPSPRRGLHLPAEPHAAAAVRALSGVEKRPITVAEAGTRGVADRRRS